MSVIITETASRFSADGDFHLIDRSGNHFIDGKCVNPIAQQGEPAGAISHRFSDCVPIGSTHPDESVREPFKVLGFLPLEEIKGKMFVKRGFQW